MGIENVNVNVPVYSLHPGKPVLPTVQSHPRSMGLFILVLSRLPGEYTTLRLPILAHRVIHLQIILCPLWYHFLLLWYEVADQTTPIMCCRGQCVTRDKPRTPHHIAHPTLGSNPRPFAQHSTESSALTIKPRYIFYY